jgi:hypothetical protein
MKPSRLGIFTSGRLVAFIASSSAMTWPSARMKAASA